MRTPAKPTSGKQTTKKMPARQADVAPKKSVTQKPASDDKKSDQPVVTLRLYVAGQTPKSLAALANLRKVCDEYLLPKYKIELEIIDLFEKPQLAAADQILAIPTLVRRLPVPVRKIIGDLSDTERVLVGLDLRAPFPPLVAVEDEP